MVVSTVTSCDIMMRCGAAQRTSFRSFYLAAHTNKTHVGVRASKPKHFNATENASHPFRIRARPPCMSAISLTSRWGAHVNSTAENAITSSTKWRPWTTTPLFTWHLIGCKAQGAMEPVAVTSCLETTIHARLEKVVVLLMASACRPTKFAVGVPRLHRQQSTSMLRKRASLLSF